MTTRTRALNAFLPALAFVMAWLFFTYWPSAETDPCVLTKPAAMDSAAPLDTKRYSLEDAAAKGLIEYEVRGNGHSSGESLFIEIQRLGDSAIDIYIRPGTVVVPGNDKVQRMVIWRVVGVIVAPNQPLRPTTSLYLPDLQPRAYVLEAYCLDFQRENPSLEDSLKVALAEDALDVRAAQVIYEGKRHELSLAGIQTAIWNDRDHLTKQDVMGKFENIKEEEIDAAFKMVGNLPGKEKLEKRQCVE